MRRVRFYTDPLAEAAGYSKMTTLIKIQLKDGQVFTGQADWAKGSPADPMSYEEVAEKFRACADYVDWDPRRAAQVIEGVRNLESLPKISELVDLCVS